MSLLDDNITSNSDALAIIDHVKRMYENVDEQASSYYDLLNKQNIDISIMIDFPGTYQAINDNLSRASRYISALEDQIRTQDEQIKYLTNLVEILSNSKQK